jgi:HNH endonuclease/AP2 domain
MEIKLKRNGMWYSVFYSECDHALVSQYNWQICNKGVRGRKKGHYYDGRYSMHRLILGLPPNNGVCVDHINGNPYDNRRENIRICTVSQNNMNRKPQGVCKYKGVSYNKVSDGKGGYYTYIRSCIRIKGRSITLGSFKTEEEAAKAYDFAAKTHFGEFAKLNFP